MPARRRSKKEEEAEIAMVEGDNRGLQDYALPQALGITSSIVSPVVEKNNFELSPSLISL